MEADRIGTPRDLPPIRTLTQWVVAAAKDKDYKEMLTYQDLFTLLQCDPQDRRGRTAILKAQRILLDDYNKYLACVNGKGYEIAHPREHADYVNRLRKQGIRKVRKSHRVAIHGDFTILTQEELRTHTMQQVKSGCALAVLLRFESKRKLETVRKEMAAMTPKVVARMITGAKD